MNRFSMLASGPPKASSKVFMPGKPSDVPTPGVRKSRASVTPQAASTRMYGKAEPAPGADLFGNGEKKPYV